eukprot:CAMPEP_0184703814 /NCGR_PEP_ID=MMETSP0313-20130426/29018_1 /TAXON_ID=2792 /ORGANISM="Porphyridium aerugineum, Strain SAG 1380-2" /LENGTH=344 /DNA_ID=CAMNT_0027164681 /DNA_START=59 /DNA_END=1093 /DNA_ORIENTATION=+
MDIPPQTASQPCVECRAYGKKASYPRGKGPNLLTWLLMITLFMAYMASSANSQDPASVVDMLPSNLNPSNLLPNLVPQGASDLEASLEEASLGVLARAKTLIKRYHDVIVGIGIPVGILLAAAGYFILHPTIFIAGFGIGSFLSYVSVYTLTKNTSSVGWATILAALLGGLVLGLSALYLVKFGIFLIGAALGIVVAFAGKSFVDAIRLGIESGGSASTAVETGPDWVMYVTMAVCGIIFGFLALHFQVHLIIVSTAFCGSFMSVYGIGYFVGHFPNFTTIEGAEFLRDPITFVYLGFYAILGILGCIIQYRILRRKEKMARYEALPYYYEDYEEHRSSSGYFL